MGLDVAWLDLLAEKVIVSLLPAIARNLMLFVISVRDVMPTR
jgi:hypothetical protein